MTKKNVFVPTIENLYKKVHISTKSNKIWPFVPKCTEKELFITKSTHVQQDYPNIVICTKKSINKFVFERRTKKYKFVHKL